MKFFRHILFSLFICVVVGFSQEQYFFNPVDSVVQDEQIPSSPTQITSLNLTGSIKIMAIVIGFPDRNHPWPTFSNPPSYPNENYPLHGAFPDGTSLREYIALNGPIDIDEWLKPGVESYLEKYSGGKYTADVFFPQKINGEPYLTVNDFQHWITLNGSSTNILSPYKLYVIQIIQEAAYNIISENPDAFDEVDMLQISFVGITKEEFWTSADGYAWTSSKTIRNPYNPNEIYFNGPIGVNYKTSTFLHEALHVIGKAVGSPQGFNGLPDRGCDYPDPNDRIEDTETGTYHWNTTGVYDEMYHSGNVGTPTYSLYGNRPLNPYDLIFLGWIEPDEIIEINSQNTTDIKLANISEPLTTEQRGTYYRTIKVMIRENYSGDLDEYFLVSYHNANDEEINFDKNLYNIKEGLYNDGALIWHVKEIRNMINSIGDQLIDLEVAQPYNGFYGHPNPDDGYPRDYDRNPGWNGNLAGDFDWLDDVKRQQNSSLVYFLPDGGQNNWELTDSPDLHPGGHYPWDPTGEDWYMRTLSLKSDFFTDEVVREKIVNQMTDNTRPSTKNWAGNKTHIAIKNIRHVDDYMMVDVYYNYWEGEVDDNSTMTGNVTINGEVTVPAGSTLVVSSLSSLTFNSGSKLVVYGTVNVQNGSVIIPSNGLLEVKPGAELNFNNSSSLIVQGTLNAVGTSNNKITFDFVNKGNYNGIHFSSSSGGTVKYCNIKNAYYGIIIFTGNANPTIQYCIISNNNYGIYFSMDAHNFVNSVYYNTIENNTYDGIYMDYGGQPEHIDHNTIRYNGRYGLYCVGYSDPDISFNNISYNSNSGICLTNYSSPDIHDNNGISDNSLFGIKCYNTQTSIYRNGIQRNPTGIFTAFSSNINIYDILMTDGTIGLRTDYNSTSYATLSAIYGYDDAGDYSLYADRTSTINAPNNCYDALPPSIYTANGSTVNWQTGAGTCGGMGKIASSDEKTNFHYGENPSSTNDGSYDEELLLAFQYVIEKNYEGAIAIYHKKFKEENDLSLKRYILSQLAFCYKKAGRKGFIDFLNKEVRVNLSTKEELYAQTVELENSFLIRESKYDKILENLDFLRSNFSNNDDFYKNTLVGLIHFKSGISNDISSANNYLDELRNRYPDDEVTFDAEIYLSGDAGGKGYDKRQNNLTKQEQFDKYELLGNYPNPFNPSTTINYTLPYQSSVEVVIYDIVGRVVKSFNVSSQSTGYQSIIWDGRNEMGNTVASGIYLYRISIKSLENNKTFIKAAKLMLMK